MLSTLSRPPHEPGSIVLTTNKAFKQWPAIFNGDSTITSAVLDRRHDGHSPRAHLNARR